MAGRLNLRPIYGRDELSPGEGVQRGIAAALAAKQQEVAEDNARRAHGQVMTSEATVGSRIGGIADRLRGIFSRGETPPAIPAEAAEALAKPPELQRNGQSLGPIPSTVAATPGTHGIAGRLAAYEEQDAHGNSWRVDPNVAADAARANAVATRRDELGVEDEAKERTTRRAIDAATAAGMPAAEADARVRTGTMRYDERFGAGQPQRRRSVAEEKELIAYRSERKLLEDKQKTHAGLTPAERERMFQLRERAQDLQERGLATREELGIVNADIRAGTAMQAPNANPLNNTMKTDAQRAADEAQAKEGAKRVRGAAGAIDKIKNRRAPREAVAARAQALKGTGKTREQIRAQLIAEGYNVQ